MKLDLVTSIKIHGALSLESEALFTLNNGLSLHRIASILINRLQVRCSIQVKGVEERADYELTLLTDEELEEEAYKVERVGLRHTIIAGGSLSGLLYGVGRWLHTTKYEPSGLIPSEWSGESKPDCTFRGIYFATHFFNYYHVAPLEELQLYLEDLALRGTNRLELVFPFVNLDGWDDPNTATSLAQLKKVFAAARRVNMKTGIGFASNNQFRNAPENLRAKPNIDPLGRKGNHGVNICTSDAEGYAYVIDNIEELCRRLHDVKPDFVVQSAYDEGGCGCEECHPWGAKGYLVLAEGIMRTMRSYFPEIEHVLSTWVFDTPYCGEWEALSQKLAVKNDWVDYILADAHEEYPSYPLQHSAPGQAGLLNFPEISMWGLFPWGGFGANPLPNRFERLWNQVKGIVQGGFPYSEGIYEDMNKAIVSGFYWNREATASETLREYINYEFSHRATEQVLQLIDLIEKNHERVHIGELPDLHEAERAWTLAVEAAELMPSAMKHTWRWRILYLRAKLDVERYRLVLKSPNGKLAPGTSWGDLLAEHTAAQEAFRELIGYYHSQLEDAMISVDHAWIRPPLAKNGSVQIEREAHAIHYRPDHS